ncbi:hypothetical protein COV24_02675 [candidate division WWE3 bacterium CG10_big_fil_rev_8_21_14_0_10_32_10]|uniref:DUF11 domain-containing protein n=1 Tax=candidate division WWE3 bacterium CG10_big_fil_rev_8_21_14_0_10_32_10 TaxID=1975090 RepID=A0A2H0RA63_UNCKA|nr:MAG: hypothetical protein COV24_02675 [candidate division WWE3 bacterium CG10_big_fil_rev_8_21_14_0_10_32_10]
MIYVFYKKLNYFLLLLFVLSFTFFLNSPIIKAADITVTCDETSCVTSPSINEALFKETEFPNYDLKPGDTVDRKITIENKRNEVCYLYLSSANVTNQTPSNFDEKLFTVIKNNISDVFGVSNGSEASSTKTLFDLFNNGTPLYLGEVNSGVLFFTWIVTFDTGAGNEFQEAKLVFDFDLSFECGEEPVQTTLFLSKSNDATTDKHTGDTVTYQLNVFSKDSVNNVFVTDLPPEGFEYTGGTWTATSNFRGDLKGFGITPEPTYHSPGVWSLGNMQKGETVILTYKALIENTVDPGLYKDLAWAKGDLNESNVLANNNSGYFVGTNVNVIKEPVSPESKAEVKEEIVKKTSEGEVLGASSEILPQTGANPIFIYIAFFLIASGLLAILLSKKIKLFIPLFLILFLCVNQSYAKAASTLSARIEEPKYNQNSDFTLSFVVLDIQNRNVQVDCYKKASGDINFINYGSGYILKPGGNSGLCYVNSSVLNSSGIYDFKIIANAGIDNVESPVVSINYNFSRPDKPKNFKKEKSNSCKYKVSFKTADDGKTDYVEIYRSFSKSFIVDSSSRIQSISLSPNTSYEYVNNLSGSECNNTPYYAVRAFDIFGNASDVVSEKDVIIKYSEKQTTTEGSTKNIQEQALVSESSQVNIEPTSNFNENIEPTIQENDSSVDLDTKNNNADSTSGNILGEETKPNFIKNLLKDKSTMPLIVLFLFGLVAYAYKRLKHKSDSN